MVNSSCSIQERSASQIPDYTHTGPVPLRLLPHILHSQKCLCKLTPAACHLGEETCKRWSWQQRKIVYTSRFFYTTPVNREHFSVSKGRARPEPRGSSNHLNSPEASHRFLTTGPISYWELKSDLWALPAERGNGLPVGARRYLLKGGVLTLGSASCFKAVYSVSDPRSQRPAGFRG